MWIAQAILSGYRIPYKLALLSIAISIAVILATNLSPDDYSTSSYRVILWGIPGALLLWAIVSLEELWHERLSGFPKLIGDASYSIYLIHTFILPFVAIILVKSGINIGVIGGLIFCVVLSLIAGIIVHLFAGGINEFTVIVNGRI